MGVAAAASLVWASLELVFLGVTMLYLAPRMNRLEVPAKYPIEAKRLMRKIVETLDWLDTQEDTEYDFHTFLEGWFLGAPTSSLRRNNVVSFLAWAMYSKEVENLPKGERKSVLEMVKVVEEKLGRTLAPGHNPDVRCIRHTLDPVVPFAHRPLAVYALLGACRAAVRVFLNICGFRRGLAPCGTFSYWHREARVAPGKENGRTVGGPVVFFHGVGSGLPWYIVTLWQVCRRRTSILVESPSIAMSLHLLRGHSPPSETQLVEGVEGIMKKHGLPRAAFFGHSFGSIAVAWMARRRPQLVSQVVLLDPVCLLLFLPNVARAFLYPEQTGLSLADKLILNLITQEMGISHTLRRHFWWYANIMWPDDIRCPMVVGLAGQDRIVPTKPLRRLLLSHPSFVTSAPPTAAKIFDGHDRSDSGCSGNGVGGLDGRVDNGGGGGSGSGANGAEDSVHSGDLAGRNGLERNGGGSSAPSFAGSGGNGGNPDAAAKRVELVYWPKEGHGHVLSDPRALSSFMRVVERQEKTFAINDPSVRNGTSGQRRAHSGSKG